MFCFFLPTPLLGTAVSPWKSSVHLILPWCLHGDSKMVQRVQTGVREQTVIQYLGINLPILKEDPFWSGTRGLVFPSSMSHRWFYMRWPVKIYPTWKHVLSQKLLLSLLGTRKSSLPLSPFWKPRNLYRCLQANTIFIFHWLEWVKGFCFNQLLTRTRVPGLT